MQGSLLISSSLKGINNQYGEFFVWYLHFDLLIFWYCGALYRHNSLNLNSPNLLLNFLKQISELSCLYNYFIIE